jgi:hypothetical protein
LQTPWRFIQQSLDSACNDAMHEGVEMKKDGKADNREIGSSGQVRKCSFCLCSWSLHSVIASTSIAALVHGIYGCDSGFKVKQWIFLPESV